jgi:transposase-like protein
MTKIPETCSPVNARSLLGTVIDEAEASLRAAIELRISRILVATVSHILGRLYHERRGQVPRQVHGEGTCCHCGSTASHRFSRNGYRKRHLLSRWGELQIDLPRVRCQCGGSVQLDFGGLLCPYQRIWDEVDAQVQRWGALAVSLRQMQTELACSHIGPLALRTLNQRLHQLQCLDPDGDPADIPSILQIDAIWVTQLRPNGKVRRDRQGRQRPVKGRHKRPILIAMGVWPDSGRCEILLWQMAESESAEAWIDFLSLLERQGIHGQNGLKLIIHDGGLGLRSALRFVYFGVVTQRCLFHKLRNICDALRLPEHLSAKQRKRRRKAILKDFRAIWEARHYQTALRRYLQVVRTYRHTQPEAVAALRNDFRPTLTYHRVEQQHPTWSRTYLRTTSRLERFNRRIRRRARAANAYHSDQGLLAMLAQEAHLFHLAQRQS